MNFVSTYPWILAGWLVCGMASASANKPLPDSSFEDWSGFVREIDLVDGSVLFEYTARSYSGRTNGAMLAITFVPRFNCEPTVNVRLPGAAHDVPADPQLEFAFSGEPQLYTGVVDREDDVVIYTAAAAGADIETLRNLIEISSRANIRILSGSVDASYNLAFSLLGSHLATLNAEKHCLQHEPLVYDPK